jgi:hypothetical protein
LKPLLLEPTNNSCSVTNIQASGVPAANNCLFALNQMQSAVIVSMDETARNLSGMEAKYGDIEKQLRRIESLMDAPNASFTTQMQPAVNFSDTLMESIMLRMTEFHENQMKELNEMFQSAMSKSGGVGYTHIAHIGRVHPNCSHLFPTSILRHNGSQPPTRRRNNNAMDIEPPRQVEQQPVVQEFLSVSVLDALDLYVFGNQSTNQLPYCDPDVEEAYGTQFRENNKALSSFSKAKFVAKRILYCINALPIGQYPSNLVAYCSGELNTADRADLFKLAVKNVHEILELDKKKLDKSVKVSTMYAWMQGNDFFKENKNFDAIRFMHVKDS